MATIVGARPKVPSGPWARVRDWATKPDNARTDFAVLGTFHGLVGLLLLAAPALTHTPSLRVLLTLAPGPMWGGAFLATFALAMLGLRVRSERWAGRFRHYAWAAAVANLAMWLAGTVMAGVGPVGALVLLTLFAWHSLTAVRLELPRALGSQHRPSG